MKAVCFIDEDGLSFDGVSVKRGDRSLSSIFRAIKEDRKISGLRIVLGKDLSCVAAVRIGEGEKMNRRKALRIASENVPFAVDDGSFDWKNETLGEGDNWAQLIAVKPKFIKLIRDAAKNAEVEIDMIIPLAIIIAKVTKNRETPVLVKWSGWGEMKVLAIKGMVDYVGSESDDKINTYAKHRWHLAVNPEQVILTDQEFDLVKEVARLGMKGSDEDLLQIRVVGDDLVSRGRLFSEAISEVFEKIIGKHGRR